MLYFFKLVLLIVSLSSSFLVHAEKEIKDTYLVIVKPTGSKSDGALNTHLNQYSTLKLIIGDDLKKIIKKFPEVFKDGEKSISLTKSNDPTENSHQQYEILCVIEVTDENKKKVSKLSNGWYANKKESSAEEMFLYNAVKKVTTFYSIMLSTSEKVVISSLLLTGLAAIVYGFSQLPFTKNAFNFLYQKSGYLIKNGWSGVTTGFSIAAKHAATYGSAAGTYCVGAAKYVWNMIPSFPYGRASVV